MFLWVVLNSLWNHSGLFGTSLISEHLIIVLIYILGHERSLKTFLVELPTWQTV